MTLQQPFQRYIMDHPATSKLVQEFMVWLQVMVFAMELINNSDKQAVWWMEAGLNGYYNGDFNRDGSIDNTDKNDYWRINTENYGSQVPE